MPKDQDHRAQVGGSGTKTGDLQEGDHLPHRDAEAIHDSADDCVPQEGADRAPVQQRIL